MIAISCSRSVCQSVSHAAKLPRTLVFTEVNVSQSFTWFPDIKHIDLHVEWGGATDHFESLYTAVSVK